MLDRTLVTSGFDTETLVSEEYLTYLLLAQIEAGLLQLEFHIVDSGAGIDLNVVLHPPQDYERLYTPEPSAPLPDPLPGSFLIELLPSEGSPVASVAFSPDGTRIASGTWNRLVRFWDAQSGVDLTTFAGHSSSVSGVAYSPNGTHVASSSLDLTVRLLAADTGAELTTFTGHTGPVFGVAFSPDGTRIASAAADGTVRLWDVASGAELRVFAGHSGPVFSVNFSPDGARLVSGSLDGTVRLWDVVSGMELKVFTGHEASVSSVAFSPDATRIASGSQDKTVRLWDVASGAQLKVFTGHEAPVSGVAYSPDGTRLVSGSQDRTARVWNVSTGAELTKFTGHTRSVLSVAFSPDGSRIASGSEDNKIRLWDAQTGEVITIFMVPFMRLTVIVTVVNNVTGQEFPPLPAGLLVDLDLEARQAENGLERNHALRLSLVRLDDATAALLEAAGVDVGVVEEELRNQFDRTVPLGVAQGQQVQQIRMRKFIDGNHRSLGFYVNLALRAGPEPDAFLEPRGNVGLAQDFRDPVSPLSFATSPDLFGLLGPHTKFLRAEETETGSGEFHFPLREDASNPDSKIIGKIKNVSIGPEIVVTPNQPPTTTGRLMIDLHGEYTEVFLDPDFHLQLFFRPKISDGIVEWDADIDVDLGLLATLLLVAGGIAIILLFGPPGLALGSKLLVGTILGMAVLKGLIAEPLAAKSIEDRFDEDAEASFLDALPFRLPAARRRWDPFYVTVHEVVTFVDKVVIDFLGIAFEGTGKVLDKEPEPVNHVVIQDEERHGNGTITALRYRVSDFNDVLADGANAPGRDRMDFTRTDPVAEPTLVSLTDSQIAERIEANRILAPITYTPERIHLVENQIDGLLCLSRRERGEQSQRLTVQLGRPPTEEEIEEAIAQVLRFDLAPEEFIERQVAGVLLLDGKEIITRHNADGTTTPYYRDRPDGDPKDNLLSLPHYTPPYQAPP